MKPQPINLPFLRSAYNYDRNAAGDESALHCKDKTLAQQHFKDECDINVIVERFGVTGEFPVPQKLPTYGDFTGVSDFHSAANAVAKANETFDALPAKVRARFHNNPAEFVDFCSLEKNRTEAIDLGLVNPTRAEAIEAGRGSIPPAPPAPPAAPKDAVGVQKPPQEPKGGQKTET